jgi:hypothetical protein
MSPVIQQTVPDDALLKTYHGGRHPERWGHYGDCFSVQVDGPVTLSQFVFAFYTSPVFRIERVILLLVGAPSIDEQAQAVAEGLGDTFAVWMVGKLRAVYRFTTSSARFPTNTKKHLLPPVRALPTTSRTARSAASPSSSALKMIIRVGCSSSTKDSTWRLMDSWRQPLK